jgi:hypothetical protein
MEHSFTTKSNVHSTFFQTVLKSLQDKVAQNLTSSLRIIKATHLPVLSRKRPQEVFVQNSVVRWTTKVAKLRSEELMPGERELEGELEKELEK